MQHTSLKIFHINVTNKHFLDKQFIYCDMKGLEEFIRMRGHKDIDWNHKYANHGNSNTLI